MRYSVTRISLSQARFPVSSSHFCHDEVFGEGTLSGMKDGLGQMVSVTHSMGHSRGVLDESAFLEDLRPL